MDGVGGLYVAGLAHYTYRRTMPPTLGGAVARGITVGDGDVWIARYNVNGERTWLDEFGSPEFDQAFAVAPYEPNAIIVAGDTQGDLFQANAGVQDAWVSLRTSTDSTEAEATDP